jgi:hypothetical protein
MLSPESYQIQMKVIGQRAGCPVIAAEVEVFKTRETWAELDSLLVYRYTNNVIGMRLRAETRGCLPFHV